MKVEIEEVENGYIVKGEGGTEVIEAKECEDEIDCDALQTLLYVVMDKLGIHGSKHHKRRVVIEIRSQRQ